MDARAQASTLDNPFKKFYLMPKSNQSRLLVDAFYYDYILSETIRIYLSDSQPVAAAHYLRIATILCKELRMEAIKLDDQLYLKEAYLKVLQMLKFYTSKFCVNTKECSLTVIIKGFESIKTITREHPHIKEHPGFQRLEVVTVALYEQIARLGRREDLENSPVKAFVAGLKSQKTMLPIPPALLTNFTEKEALQILDTIQFERPVMGKFVNFVKEGIDRNQ